MTTDEQAWEEQLIADLRANGGRPSQGPLAGHPLLLLYTTGVKSGQRRRSILTFSMDGDAFVVAGTNSGHRSENPKWLPNVQANPNVTVEVGGKEFAAVAKEVTGPERDRLWDQHVAQLPWFSKYPEQVSERSIPVVRIMRASGA